MAQNDPNRVRQAREARGLSQVALAAAAQLTRQSLSAIEAGRTTPGVDIALRIARALDRPVEELFGGGAGDEAVTTEVASPASSGRVALGHIAGRWVAHSLDRDMHTSADALVGAPSGAADLLRASADARDNVVVMGCAAGLGLLTDRLNSRPGPGRFVWLARSSTEALDALARDQTHVAGVHLVDTKTGDSNLPDVRRIVRGRPTAVITFARWQAGLVVAQGNPKRIRDARDLGRRNIRLVVREQGSGARRLLERSLRAAGAALDIARTASIRARGHVEVAQTVAYGAADAGIATRDVAVAHGLAFIPLAEERYDLALPLSSLGDARIVRLLDVLSSAGLRNELAALGYDVGSSGARVAEIDVR